MDHSACVQVAEAVQHQLREVQHRLDSMLAAEERRRLEAREQIKFYRAGRNLLTYARHELAVMLSHHPLQVVTREILELLRDRM